MMSLSVLKADIANDSPDDQIESLFSAGFYKEAMLHPRWAAFAESPFEERWIDSSSDAEVLDRWVRMTQTQRFELCMPMQAIGVEGNSVASVDTYHGLFQIANLCRGPRLPIVLIEGEMGSGKGVHGKALHYITGREGELQKVPMATVAPERAESILFGHVRGAFTGADKDFIGCFENCSGGTVILDDINGTQPSCHAKLLTVLDDRTVTPLGSNEIRSVADTLIVVTSNQDLSEAGLPDDIVQRLTGNRLRIPDLGSRFEDVPAIVAHFLVAHGPAANCLWEHRERIAHHLRRAALDSQINVRDVRNAVSQLVQDSQEVDINMARPERKRRVFQAASELFEGGEKVNPTNVGKKLGCTPQNLYEGGGYYDAWESCKADPEFQQMLQ